MQLIYLFGYYYGHSKCGKYYGYGKKYGYGYGYGNKDVNKQLITKYLQNARRPTLFEKC